MMLTDTPATPTPLSPETYRQLRLLARARLRGGGREALLDTTVLVHEAYLRMADVMASLREPHSLMGYASRTMRSVIVDFARKRGAERHGGDACFVTFTGDLADPAGNAAARDILRVHEALEELEALDAPLARVVEMRWFAGMSEPEIAAATGVSERTVRRQWDKARLLLEVALGA